MHWLLLALTVAALYGAYNFCMKLAGGEIHVVVGAVVVQATATLLGLAVLLVLKLRGETFAISPLGLRAALGAGVCVCLAEIGYIGLFSRAVPASVGIPIVVGGTVAVGALLGVGVLGEPLPARLIAGLLLVVAGVAVLGAR